MEYQGTEYLIPGTIPFESEARDLVSNYGETGLAYAAVITLMKMDKYRHAKDQLEYAKVVALAVDNTDQDNGGPTNNIIVACAFAKHDFTTWLDAVEFKRFGFWRRMIDEILALKETRRGYMFDPDLGGAQKLRTVLEAARDNFKLPQLNGLSWAFPAWWATSAPNSTNAAGFLSDFLRERQSESSTV